MIRLWQAGLLLLAVVAIYLLPGTLKNYGIYIVTLWASTSWSSSPSVTRIG